MRVYLVDSTSRHPVGVSCFASVVAKPWSNQDFLMGRSLLSQQSWSAGTPFGTRPGAFQLSQGSMALIRFSPLASPEVVRRLLASSILHLSGDLETCRRQRRSTEFMIFQIRLSNPAVHVTRMTCTTFASKPCSLEYSSCTLQVAGSLDCRREQPRHTVGKYETCSDKKLFWKHCYVQSFQDNGSHECS